LKERFVKTEGIVLNSINFGEGHKIINFFTKDYGKIEASAFGVRKTKSRFGSKLEPFNVINLFLYRKPENKLFTIRDVDVILHNISIGEKLNKIIIANSIIESVIRFVEKSQEDQKLYNLLRDSLIILNEVKSERAIYLLSMYELKFLTVAGYTPQTNICVRCENRIDSKEIYFDPNYGFPICRNCKNKLSKDVYEGSINFINWAITNSLDYSKRVTMEKKTLYNVRDIIEVLYMATFNRGLESWKQILINESRYKNA